MKRPIQFFLRYPVVTLAVALLVVLAGLNALFNMPRMEDPSITIRTGLVLAAYPGASAEQVEQQVTRPIEDSLFKFPEVRKGRTFATSRPGLAILNVELEDHVDVADTFWAKLRAEMARLKASGLPQGVMGPLVDSDFGETVAMLIAVHGDRFGYRELRDHADRVKDELRSIREVGRLVTYGAQEEQLWITGNPGRLAQYPLDPARIAAALNQRNDVAPAGSLETPSGKVPLRTPGLFDTEGQLRRMILDVSPGGQPVYLGDLAQVERRYRDPESLVRYDGRPCLLISVEMQKGNNIVQMGDQVAAALARARRQLPTDLHLDFIANQPKVVGERMHHLGIEFLLAIGSVILVALVLLPMRVAIIAALAIPVTMLGTLGILDAVGIQLHQVSIAALIVVLGIVVDDAIVIADNYLELLDHGCSRVRAAWRSASEVFVPVLTATLTIIASFLPLLILKGSVGEFIRALPITVALALAVSFLVAIFITPLLCRKFIAKGLKADPAEGSPKGPRLLDRIQSLYGKAIGWLMPRRTLALGLGTASVALGFLMFTWVPEQFFPSAERNQFVIDLWMPEGTRIGATQEVLARIEGHLKNLPAVDHFATFVGESAPRFYYNVNPQQPDSAYGQIVVNTKYVKLTEALVQRLQGELTRMVPEGMALVKELQQGDTMEAPVEVRIIGARASDVKVAGRKVEDLLRGMPETQFVHNDHFNDSPAVQVNVDPELAARLGLTHMGIGQLLAGASEGAPVSVFWEGDRAVPVLLRMDAPHRESYGALRGMALGTPGGVPLGGVAQLNADWQSSRLVRRNGLPTLTVRCFAKPGHYGSAIQARFEKLLAAQTLPGGVRVEYGGEAQNQGETLPMMVLALAISLGAIFLVMLLQFRNLKEPLVIMAAIPLSLFGAMAGLLVTGNPFGFTAFMGMISLCGMVVRNAIILVDFIKERRAAGVPLREAAMEAGARRLRPIFLTTLAAAVGVLPMILSGSKLWSPLAGVIALGLIFSMLFTLLVIPVLYVTVMERRGGPSRTAMVRGLPGLLLLGGLLAGGALRAQSLQVCVDRALQRNPAVRIAQAKVEEERHRLRIAQADYAPQLKGEVDWSRATTTGLVTIPAGSFGTLGGTDPFPAQSLALDQGSRNLTVASLTLGQPLTQLFKVRQAEGAARKDLEAAQAELDKVKGEVRQGVHQAYFGLLIARQQQGVARAEIAAMEAQQEESRAALQAGHALEVVRMGAGASLLQARQRLQAAGHQEEDALGELRDLTGAELNEPLDPQGTEVEPVPLPELSVLLEAAQRRNAELRAARALHGKSLAGIQAAKLDYVPDLSAYVKVTQQSGVPFVKSSFTSAGLQLSWTLFDWGKRSHFVSQRRAESVQARENVIRLERRLDLDVRKAHRKLEDARSLLGAAEQALAYQGETFRIARDQREAGLISPQKLCEAQAAEARARLEALQAKLGVCLAGVELERLTWETGR